MKLTFAYSNVREFRATYTCPAVLNGWGASQTVIGTGKIQLGSGAMASEDCNPVRIEDLFVIFARIVHWNGHTYSNVREFRAAYECPVVLSSWGAWQ